MQDPEEARRTAALIGVIYVFLLAYYRMAIASRIRSDTHAPDIISVESLRQRNEDTDEYQARSRESGENNVHMVWAMYVFILTLIISMSQLADEFPVWSAFTLALLGVLGILALLLLRANRDNIEEASINVPHRKRIIQQIEKDSRTRRRLATCFNVWIACMGISILCLLYSTSTTSRTFWKAVKNLARHW